MNALAKCALLAALLAVSAPQLNAQSQGAADAMSAAYDLFSAGNYAEAAAAYEKVLKDYPTDASAQATSIQLAQAKFFLGDFAGAEATLNSAFTGPPLSADLREGADAMLPQILLSKAAALPAGDPGREAAYNDAITKLGGFLAHYPNSAQIENTLRSIALANFALGKFDDAASALEQNLQRFPRSPTISSSKDLLALILATQGAAQIAKPGPKKDFSLYNRAAGLLREIINDKTDLAMVNDASLQLGEILLNQAAYSPPADQPALYRDALEAFRAVASPEQVVQWQKEKIASFRYRKRAALEQKDMTLLAQLNRQNEFELRKLAEIQARPDQTAGALLKMAEIYFQQGKYNESRVILDHVEPFLATGDDHKRADYFLAMSYAMQAQRDRAQELYDAFLAAHPGDPLADNLPYAMGSMSLALNDPARAVTFFDKSLELYPAGRFVEASRLGRASAEAKMGKIDEALKTFQDVLAKNPPADVAATAQSGIATMLKDVQKWDDAIAAYRVVTSKYPGTPQAAEAAYWIAVCTQQKGDNDGAIPLLDSFLAANPANSLAPLALYAKANAQIALGKKHDAIGTLDDLARKFPNSQPAPFTYFTRARLLAQEARPDEAAALLRQFIATYPQDDKLLSAHDAISEIDVSDGKLDDAVATYRDFLRSNPDSPKAGAALAKIADMKRANAEAIGRYDMLAQGERDRWKSLVAESISTVEELERNYSDSPDFAAALQTLLADERLLVAAGLEQDADVEKYFQTRAGSAQPGAKSRLLFALASYLLDKDKAQAFALMSGAYDPKASYLPEDLDTYGSLLLDQGRLDDASVVFDKLAADFPAPAGMPPDQVPRDVQEAQAFALFGKARIAQARHDIAAAGGDFRRIRELYPWFPKILDVDYGVALSLREEKKYDDALALLGEIIRTPSASAELRADSMLLGGDIMNDKRGAAANPANRDEFLAAAIDYYIKIAQFYGGVPAAASRGLWEGGGLLELQAAGSNDAKFKAAQLGKARDAYRQILTDFPSSEFASKARERLDSLK